MGVETRLRYAVSCRASALPRELWQLIMSFLSPAQALGAALVCSDFAAAAMPAAAAACRRLWPQHALRLASFGPGGVQRFLKLVAGHEAEAAAHPDVEKATTVQKLVCPEHRQIAVEWLIEVSWDWQLENTVVFRGVAYLDHYLASHAVPALGKFQMISISALRTALKHSSKLTDREKQRLACKHWAEVTDGACTEAEVRATCTKLDRVLTSAHRAHPGAKQRLRFLWYRLHDAGAVAADEVYVYMLASFLLHLSLLDAALSAVTPTKLATAALSLSLGVFGLQPMPPALQEHCFYVEAELQEVHGQLRRAQEEIVAPQLRGLWLSSYSYTAASALQQPAYSHLQRVVAARGKLDSEQPMPGSSKRGRQSLGAAAAAQQTAKRVTRASSQRQQQAAPPAAVAAAAASPAAPPVLVGAAMQAITPAAVGAAAAAAAALPQLASSSQGHTMQQQLEQQAAADAAGRRMSTRELPPRAVRVANRYGIPLDGSASKHEAHAQAAAAAPAAAAAGGGVDGRRGACASGGHPHPHRSAAAAAGPLASPGAGPSSSAAAAAAAAGPSSSLAAAAAGPSAVPQSPKHSLKLSAGQHSHNGGHRGLGALFAAGAGWVAAGGGGGSSSSRLLSSIPSKPHHHDEELGLDPELLLALASDQHQQFQKQQQQPSSNASSLQQHTQHMPILRSTKRTGATHTRSSSSQW